MIICLHNATQQFAKLQIALGQHNVPMIDALITETREKLKAQWIEFACRLAPDACICVPTPISQGCA